jgi:hypothetical protein
MTDVTPLNQWARDVTSNSGEDGIIQKIFEVIGAKNHWCVELGALDGIYDSNTWDLINTHAWSAVLIEAEPSYVKKLRALYANNPKVFLLERFIGLDKSNSLDAALAETPIPHDFDLLVLDVDGNEYHLWNSLEKFRPRVVVVEFNPTIPNDIEFVQPKDMSIQQGSSLRSIEKLAAQKHYRLIATTAVNALFVDAPLFESFGMQNASLDALHTDTRFYTRLFQLYDGTLVLSGYQRLFWHKIPLSSDAIQVLPKWKRHYPARVHPSARVRHFKEYIRALPIYPLLLRMKRLLYSLGSRKDI